MSAGKLSAEVARGNISVGDVVMVRGVRCRVFRVLPMGTVDVVALDNSGAWRVSGLAMVAR